MKYILIVIFTTVVLISCGETRIGEQQSLGLNVKKTTVATVETTPTPQGKEDDSADDPAIWVNFANPEHSIVFGTDKKGGIAAYGLDGQELAYYKVGKINNIDIRQKVDFNDKSYDVLAGTNRTDNSIYFAVITSDGKLVEQPLNGMQFPEGNRIYGFALGYVDNELLVVANDKEGNIYIYAVNNINNQFIATFRKQIRLNSQPEGMVVDDGYQVLYVGEEEKGIWKINLNNYDFKLLKNSQERDNALLKYDIEGISLYPTNETEGYLLASSQGNNSYLVFQREGDNAYITSFRVIDGIIDGIEETDGIDMVNYDFGPKFPEGFFVAQDGFNYDSKRKKSQNFKLVDWRNIQRLIQANE